MFRKVLEEDVARREVKGLKARLEGLAPVLEKISISRIVESVREDREQGNVVCGAILPNV